jgi:hypothetical protein
VKAFLLPAIAALALLACSSEDGSEPTPDREPVPEIESEPVLEAPRIEIRGFTTTPGCAPPCN